MKNKSLKGKLILSVATLGLAAASTIGSTFAWFTINTSATATGVNMTATSGDLVMIRKTTSATHNEAFSDSATIKTTSEDKTWMPVSPISDTSNAAATVTDDVKWGALNINKTLATETTTAGYVYDDLSCKQIDGTEAYSANTSVNFKGAEDTTKSDYIAYAHFVIDYVVTKDKGPKLTLTGIDSITNEYFKKSVRIAIAEASSITATNNKWTVAYGTYTTYSLAEASTDDLQYKALQELGVTAASQSGTLKTTTFTDAGISLSPKDTSSSGADSLGSISVYVWIDGNAKDCTNAAQSGTCTIGFTFETTK